MNWLVRGRFTLPALVLLTLAALAGLAWASLPGATPTPHAVPQRVPVTSATRICPLPASASNGTRIALYSAGHPGGAVPGGGAGLAALGGSGPSLEQAAQPGRLWLFSATKRQSRALRAQGAAQAPVTVRADGAMAQGLEVEETSRPQGTSSTLAGLRCPEPGTDFWFTGAGQAAAGSIQLYLINPDSQAASADVDVYTDSGPLQGSSDTGLTVPPGGRLVQSVDRLVPGSQALALHVRTTAGRLVAAVQVGGPVSGSWLPETGQPSTAQLIPGLPASGGSRRLYLADPGGSDAQVNVHAITASGEYEPTGDGGIDISSGTATSVDLSSTNGVPAALRVTSSVPVATGLEVGGGWGAAAGPITQQSVVADDAAGHGYATTVVLTAPAAAARVALATASTTGPTGSPASRPGQPGSPGGQVVTIPAGRSTSVKIAAPRGGGTGFAIVVTPLPGSGPVYAGRALSGPGGAQTIMPLVSAPTSVPLPAVSGSLTAVMP